MDALTGQRSGFPARALATWSVASASNHRSTGDRGLNQIAVCDHELRVEHQRALLVVFGRHALTGLSDDL